MGFEPTNPMHENTLHKKRLLALTAGLEPVWVWGRAATSKGFRAAFCLKVFRNFVE
jgi:hypothetical protein